MTAENLNDNALKSSHSIAPECAFSVNLPPLRLGLFDLGGVLHHGNYLNLLEAARESYLESKGISYPKLASENKHLAVVDAQQFFLRPIRYGQRLEVRIWIKEISRVSVNVIHEILNPNDSPQVNALGDENRPIILHRSQVRLVFVMDNDGVLKTSRLPDELKAAFTETLSL
jgi:YbgC/YbaW family acyl-CoA thioester hydrolase